MIEAKFYPLSRLGFIIEHAEAWLLELRQTATALMETVGRPAALDGGDVSVARRFYLAQVDDVAYFEALAAKWWGYAIVSAEQRAGLEVLRVSLAQVRQTITRILHLIEDVDPVDIVQLRVSTAGGVTLGEYLEKFREEYRSTMT